MDIEAGPAARKANKKFTDKELDEADNHSVDMSVAASRVPKMQSGDDNESVGTINSAESEASRDPRYTGTYHVCGISTCGSLRFPGSPGKHGGFLCMTIEDVDEAMQKLPQTAAMSSSSRNSVLGIHIHFYLIILCVSNMYSIIVV